MLQAGEILHERYQLQQKLGQVAGRQTWLAADQSSSNPGERVVVKLLAVGDAVQWDDLKLFEREAQVLRQLNHLAIPKYRDFFSVDDRLLWFGLVQEYIAGDSLKQLLIQGKHFSEAEIRRIAVHLLELLTYLHELSPPVLHRDIKPSNLIWGQENQIYLVDFGAVQDRAAKEGATFTVVGTYGYAPMEQFGGRAVPASDLYGLGATLIHLLTGIAPGDLPQKQLRIQFRDRVSVSPDLVSWIEKLTEPDVEQRFRTTRQALDALQPSLPKPPQIQVSAHPRSLPSPAPTRPVQSQAISPTPRSQPSGDKAIAFKEDSAAERAVLFREAFLPDIAVHRTTENLLIRIPGSNLWNLLWLFPISIAILLGFQVFLPVFNLIFWQAQYWILCVLLTAMIAAATYWEFLPTFVEFDRAQFYIYKLPMGRMVYIANDNTSAIENVFHTLKQFRSGKSVYEKRVIVIQVGHQEHCFAKGLSWDDCSWLVREIQDWL